MRNEIAQQVNIFKVYNDIALKHEIVVFGGSYAAAFPFYELAQKYLFSNAIYNRSIKELTLTEAEECLNDCVCEIHPDKLFLCLGEHDIGNAVATGAYRRILRKLHSKLPKTQIYALPVFREGAEIFNNELRELCKTEGAEFLDIRYTLSGKPLPYGKIFKQLSRFFRKTPLTPAEAFSLGY
ncbi:MAG: SGNH/GDSL hydrolase family protein [Clostridia bacterium]|nr:SGNH/GDSL hydrolase family protein [Clostridia bacterium]